jgi:hypothetical protein
MKQVADFLRRVWQGNRPASNIQIPMLSDHRDRSSMADFVRILQAQDRDGQRAR